MSRRVCFVFFTAAVLASALVCEPTCAQSGPVKSGPTVTPPVAPQAAPRVAPAVAPASTPANYDTLDRYQTVLRTLLEGIRSDKDGTQHAALAALRQLRDPALGPLFERLINSEDWSLRVDCVLGLAELSASGKVDIARVEQLPGEADREAAINAVIALKLVDSAQVKAMLAWSDLPSSQRVILAGELRRLGEAPDSALLIRLASSKTPEVAGLAVGILLDLKAAQAAQLAAKSREQIAALAPATRSAVIAQIAEACSVDGLVGAGPYIASLLTLPELTEENRQRTLGSLLVLSPTDAYPALAAAVIADRSTQSLLRYGSVLLASGARAPAAEWARFRSSAEARDEVLDAIADAGSALTDGDFTNAYAKLVATERRSVLRGALDGAHRIGPTADRAFGLACLALIMKPGPTPPQVSDTLLLSLFRLAELEPGELRGPLATDPLDPPTQDALLMALLNAGTPAAAEVARTIQGRASRTGEGQIAVLVARNSPSITPAELEELMRVAGGGVNVAFPVRTQAAWLWLRHSKKINDAIAMIAPDTSTTPVDKTQVEKSQLEKTQ